MTDLLLARDHRGVGLKEFIVNHLIPIDKDITADITTLHDCGCYDDSKKIDYPDIVRNFAGDFKTYNRGILVCGSGYGVSIMANRFVDIRAVVCRSVKEVQMARKHNDANVLCLGSDFTKKDLALKIVEAFLGTKFEGGRHKTRVEKLWQV